MKTATHFTVLTPLEFIEDVKTEAGKATKRVWAQAMDAEPGEIADTFLRIFPEAAKRGVDTRFHVDSYVLMVTDGYFHYWPFISQTLRRSRKQKVVAKQKLAEQFKEAGVQLLYTNPPSLLDHSFPVRGRNHMKMVVVDNIAWLGGVNFLDPNFKALDVMVKLTDPAIVSEVAYIFATIDNQETLRDMAIECNPETKLLIDGGRINRSLILRHAVALVDGAKETLQLIAPLIPDADLLLALKRAQKRGIQVQVIAPESKEMKGIYVLLDEFNGFMLRLRGGGLPIQFKSHMIHAKILIVDGKEAIVGSHNFVSRGVRMGTEEIALQSTDPTLVKNLSDFYDTLKASS